MSPVAMCGMPYSLAMRLACVPLPAPWAPRIRMFSTPRFLLLLQEAFVGAHHHLRLHLAHGVERDTDHDDDRGASQGARGRLREVEVVDEEAREHRDEPEVDRAGKRQARENAVEVLRGRRAGSDAGD